MYDAWESRSCRWRINGDNIYTEWPTAVIKNISVNGVICKKKTKNNLLLLYATGVIKLVQNCGLYAHAYADDLQIYGHVNPAQSPTLTARMAVRSADTDCHSWATGIFIVRPVILEFSSSCAARPGHLTAGTSDSCWRLFCLVISMFLVIATARACATFFKLIWRFEMSVYYYY